MAKGLLRFRTLIPEQDFFELEDGRQIPFRSSKEFDAADMARMDALQKRQEQAMGALRKSLLDAEAGKELDQVLSQVVQLILPDIPEETLERLHAGQKGEMLAWWTAQNSAAQNSAAQNSTKQGGTEGNAAAGQTG